MDNEQPKKAIRTYGRKRDPLPTDTVLTSFPQRSSTPPHPARRSPSPVDADASSTIFSRYGRPSLKDALAAIDDEFLSDEESTRPAVAGATSPLRETSTASRYGGRPSLKDALAAIDAQFLGDDDSAVMMPKSPLTTNTQLDVNVGGGEATSPIQPALASSDVIDNDDDSDNDHPSPHPVPTTSRRRVSARVVDSDDDDDGSAPPPLSKSISKSRASPAPPSSDDELPERISLNSRPKPKTNKPVSSRAPLALNEEPVGRSHRRRDSQANKAAAKVKAPTKKELEETRRDRGRLAAQTKAGLQRVEKPAKFTLGRLMSTLVQPNALLRTASLDDPITAFSSSPQPPPAAAPRDENEQEMDPFAFDPFIVPAAPAIAPVNDLPALPNDDDDEDLPDVSVLKSRAEQRQTLDERKRALASLKEQLVAQQQRAAVSRAAEDDEDDLVIESTKSKAAMPRKARISEARKRQLAVTEFGRAGGSSMSAGSNHLRDLHSKMEQERVAITRHKESKWKELGGEVMEVVAPDVNEKNARLLEAVQAIAEKGRITAEARMHVDAEREGVEADGDDEDDEDWTEENAEADITMVDENAAAEDEENAPVQTKNRGRRSNVVLDSDDEDNDKSVSPTTEDGDKENDESFLFDKENQAALVQRRPLGTLQRPGMLGRQGSLFGLEDGFHRSLSMSPGDAPMLGDDDDENENDENAPVAKSADRRPLRSLPDDDMDPFGSAPLDFAERLKQQQSSPTSTQPTTPELTLRPTLEPEPHALKFNKGGAVQGLQPGFSDLFEAGSEQPERALKPLGRGVSFVEKASSGGLFGQLRKPLALGLTQDVELQPAFQVGDRLREQAETIFAKEQEFVLEAASKGLQEKNQQPQLYINENGFLTQTRPDDEEEPELYQPSSPIAPLSPSFSQLQPQTQANSAASSTQKEPQSLRLPLRTLSLKADDFPSPDSDSPAPSPRRRLVKGQRPVVDAPGSPTLGPQQPRNAFDVLQNNAFFKEKKPLKKSEFIEGEAEESDDDNAILNSGGGGEDEEDGEDQDRTLETLVDDAEMDEKTAAAAAVLEKFQEQMHEDDLEVEKLHQAAARGDLRKRRRPGMGGLDDSDDEDDGEDYRNRKMRRGMHGAQIDRDNIKAMAEDPATNAFYQAYAQGVALGDEREFDHLYEEESQPVAGPSSGVTAKDDGGDESGDEEEEQQTISPFDVRRQIQEMAQNGELDTLDDSMDVQDTSWIDQQMMEEEETQTKVVAVARKINKRPTTDISEHERMSKWHKSEARTARNAGTGRASGRNTVVGQRQSINKQSASTAPSNKQAVRRPVRPAASILSGVAADRSTRFE
ncbi:MRC1 domain-containing protein [Mycena chlorophos]|uniref:MRC1 domain-containing protein n=1 Tax=Mycena chlorophos TaxID=658473 RepID=A0A8H6TB91_MYCCL|nr:MRC1 domain-containing protein [Mycena chlorophos]